MKRQAQSSLSVEGQQAFDQYASALKQEDLAAKSIRNYLSDLRQFMAWCECSWCEGQDKRFFTPRATTPSLLIRYRTYLQTMLGLKPSTINRTFMSLKRYFAWALKVQLIEGDSTETIKFLPKEATAPRHLEDDEEGVLVAAVNIHGTLRDRTIIMLLLHTGLRTEELCTLTYKQLHVSKRNGTLLITGKRKKERSVPLNAPVRFALLKYLETLPLERTYPFPLEKTGKALTERALGYLIAKYARLAQVFDVSPHDLCHHFGYRVAEAAPLHRLAQIMGDTPSHDALRLRALQLTEKQGERFCSCGSRRQFFFQKGTFFPSSEQPTYVKSHTARCHHGI